MKTQTKVNLGLTFWAIAAIIIFVLTSCMSGDKLP